MQLSLRAATASTGANGEAAEHVMLSYNWGTRTRSSASQRSKPVATPSGSTSRRCRADGGSDGGYRGGRGRRVLRHLGGVQGVDELPDGAQYAFQQQKDMVPLVEEDYRPKGIG